MTYSSLETGMISEVDELEVFSVFLLPTATLGESSCRSTEESVSTAGTLNFSDSVFCFKESYIKC